MRERFAGSLKEFRSKRLWQQLHAMFSNGLFIFDLSCLMEVPDKLSSFYFQLVEAHNKVSTNCSRMTSFVCCKVSPVDSWSPVVIDSSGK